MPRRTGHLQATTLPPTTLPSFSYFIFNKWSAIAETGDRLVTIDMGRKERGLLCPVRGGGLGPHLTQ